MKLFRIVLLIVSFKQLLLATSTEVCINVTDRLGQPKRASIVEFVSASGENLAPRFRNGCAADIAQGTYRYSIQDLRFRGVAGRISGELRVDENRSSFWITNSEQGEDQTGNPLADHVNPLRIPVTLRIPDAPGAEVILLAALAGHERFGKRLDDKGVATFYLDVGVYIAFAVREGKVTGPADLTVGWQDAGKRVSFLMRGGALRRHR